jgi:hypothetical protein
VTLDIFGGAILLMLFAAPLLIDRYLRHLPVAPACPSCRSVTREAGIQSGWLSWLPVFARTFLAECGRCGWRGRMRWRFAPQAGRYQG